MDSGSRSLWKETHFPPKADHLRSDLTSALTAILEKLRLSFGCSFYPTGLRHAESFFWKTLSDHLLEPRHCTRYSGCNCLARTVADKLRLCGGANGVSGCEPVCCTLGLGLSESETRPWEEPGLLSPPGKLAPRHRWAITWADPCGVTDRPESLAFLLCRCRNLSFPDSLPEMSIVFIFVNEALSVLLRSIHSAIERTPPHLLKEIILVDDNSSNGECLSPLLCG